jgi:hypothetical protein
MKTSNFVHKIRSIGVSIVTALLSEYSTMEQYLRLPTEISSIL